MIQYYGTLFDMGFFLFQIHIIKLFNIAFEDRLEKLFKRSYEQFVGYQYEKEYEYETYMKRAAYI